MLRTLAELIREGSKLNPQGFSLYYNVTTGATCAFGAASMAAFNSANSANCLHKFLGQFTVLKADEVTRSKCPVEDCTLMRWPLGTITHLNDTHKWTREAIADWIDATWFVQPYAEVQAERPWLKQ